MELAVLLSGHESCTPSQCLSTTHIKCKTVATMGSQPTFAIEDYVFYEVDHVTGVGVQPRDNYGWDVSYDTTLSGEAESFYFCIDTIYSETWPHWVDESAVYLLLFSKLRKIYPRIKIYSLKHKVFKEAMYRAFEIWSEDVVFHIESKHNRFVFPHYISLADHRLPYLFLKHMKNFYRYIVSKCPTKGKDIDILYLPRGKKENSKGTDRTVPVQAQLIDFFSATQKAKILFTDDTVNMIEQWDTVRRAKVIILNEGGNHGINGFFAYDSDIIVLGGDGNACHFQNPSPALMQYDALKRKNRYYHIGYHCPINIVLDLLMAVIEKRATPESVPDFSCWRKCSYCKNQEYGNSILQDE